MNTHILPASDADGLTRGPLHGLKGHRPPVTSHESPVTSCKSFSFTLLSKNASANPLVSHTFKTKDLKPFRFTHFQKKGGGYPPAWSARAGRRLWHAAPATDHESPVTSHESRVTSCKCFRFCTYVKTGT